MFQLKYPFFSATVTHSHLMTLVLGMLGLECELEHQLKVTKILKKQIH